MKKSNTLHYAWILLGAVCVVRSLSAAAINNTGGLFLKPVADELGVGIGSLSIYFSISSIATLIFMPFAGKLVNKYSMKRILFIAIVLQSGAFAMLGSMNRLWEWYLLSIPLGIGSALLVNLAGPILINRWFVKNSGIALGILMACAGAFGVVFQPLVSQLIQMEGWRHSYFTVGIGVFILSMIITVLLIKSKPEDKQLQPYGADEMNSDRKKQSTMGVGYHQARKSSSFYMLVIFMIAITAFGAFNQHMATFGASLGFQADAVGRALSLGMIGSTFGAILIGLVSDRVGVFKTALGILLTVIASIVSLLMAEESYMLFSLGSFLLGLAAMGIPVLAPLLTKDFFGERDYEIIYSNVMVGPPLATVALLPLYGFIYDSYQSYQLVFILLLILTVAGALGLVMGYRKKPSH